MDAQTQSLIFAAAIAFAGCAGCISTFFIIRKRGHLTAGFSALALIFWPLALLISLCIPAKKEEKDEVRDAIANYHNQ